MVVVLIAADALSAPHVQTIQDALGADNPPPALSCTVGAAAIGHAQIGDGLLLVGAEVHSSLRPWI